MFNLTKSLRIASQLVYFCKGIPGLAFTAVKRIKYVTSGLSEPWSLNQFRLLRERSSYENDT